MELEGTVSEMKITVSDRLDMPAYKGTTFIDFIMYYVDGKRLSQTFKVAYTDMRKEDGYVIIEVRKKVLRRVLAKLPVSRRGMTFFQRDKKDGVLNLCKLKIGNNVFDELEDVYAWFREERAKKLKWMMRRMV